MYINNSKYYKKKTYCNNCNSYGHVYKNCRLPITSYGIICYRIDRGKIKYLLIRRRNSYAYVDFMKSLRNNLFKNNPEYIKYLFENMTHAEHDLLNKYKDDFDYLWNNLWLNNVVKHNWDKENCKKIFFENDISYCLENYLPKFSESEWGIPKGKRTGKESNMDCALREFNEETGIDLNDIEIKYDKYYTENFIAYNNIRYKSIYYICKYNKTDYDLTINENNTEQICEIDELKWLNLNQCKNYIRQCYTEKKNIFFKIDKFIRNNEIY